VPETILHNLATLLVRTAQRWPRLPAVAVGRAVRHDYETLARRTAGLAGGLRATGLAAGDRIVVLSRNHPSYIEALFACWWAGLIAVPVNAKLHPKELDFVLADSGARFAFVDDTWHAMLPRVDRVQFGVADYERLAAHAPIAEPAAVAADDAAWLFYTSGTTGRPKGVEITHGNLAAMGRCFLRWDRALFFAAPTMVKRLLDAPALGRGNLAHLKCIVYGGGPMYVADCKAAYAALGARLAQIYGQGETPMTITAMGRAMLAGAVARGDDARIASVGCAQTGIDVRIAGPDDRALPAGAIGEVLVRGPTVMRGYWRNAEATQTTLAGGWLHTGDLGECAADGFLTLKDRSKDLIISGGSNIYPREVEEALLTHPDVAEVAVIGRPHAEWGEEVVAFVVARSPPASADATRALETALDAACLAEIARFKRPKAYVFVAELPKNNTGKVVKAALREALREALRAAG
jgi:long-chain acyl-CoA synthetase